MPKIIKDIENTLKNSAIELFIEFGYSNVDMRMISKASKIAVGTIYNYYENKKELYISILEESWTSTFEKLDKINSAKLPERQKCAQFISALYEDIEERNGLGKTLITNSPQELINDERILNLKSSLLLRVDDFIKSLNKMDSINKCPNNETRLAKCLLASILAMFELHGAEKKDNIDFLIEFINLSIK